MDEIGFSDETLEVEGIRLRYRTGGIGPALVCIPGLGGLRKSRAHGLLARKRRVVAIGVPGFGDVPAAPGLATHAEIAGLLNRAVAMLGIERLSLMGHGLGAGLALAMALARPEAVEAIVLSAPMALRPQRRVDESVGRDLLYAHPERWPEANAIPEIGVQQRDAAARLMSEFAGATFEASLQDLRVPVLSLFGTSDRLSPTGSARLYRTMLPGGYIVMVYDAAHVIEVERPEAVASIVADFLERGERFIVSKETGLINP